MPIFNASVTGEGGGQGGGDKVTALVGSNASGIDVGDKVILNYPATYDINYTSGSSINYPYYFDGYFLYASGGIFATDGAGSLTYLGSSGSLSGSYGSENYHRYFPPTYTSNGICFGYGGTRNGVSYFGLMFFSSGAYSGAFRGPSGTQNRALLIDARFDSDNTGFASLLPVVDYNNYEAHLVYVSNGSVTVKADNAYFPFFTENGDCYAASWSTDKFYKVTCDGSTITYTDLGSSGIVEAMFGAATSEFTYRAVQSSRKDDYQFWYHAGNSIKGFTHIDTTNNTIAQITTPLALNAVKGTVFAAWWDLDNKLFIRTSTGLFVFAYTNHDISTMQLVKKFEWSTDYSGPATCSNDLMSYAVGNNTYVKVVRETVMPIYEFSANVYNGQNFAGTSLTGFVNEAITTDPYGQSIVEVNTVKDPADTWTNVGTPFGFDVSTTSTNVSVGRGYYNSGSAEVIIPSTVTKTLAQASSGQTTGFKNDVVVYHDTSDNNSALICKTGTTPVGTFKASTALTTPVYLSPDKTVITGTDADSGFAVSYEPSSSGTDGSVTVGEGYSYIGETDAPYYLGSDLTRPASQMVVHSEDFVVTTIPMTDYTVVGSPTITGSVVSGFTASDYISGPSVNTDNSDTFEGVLRFKQTSARTAQTDLFYFGGYYAGIDASNNFILQAYNGSSWSYVATGSAVPVNQWVYIKCTKAEAGQSKNQRYLYSSTDGETWTQECSLSNTYNTTRNASILPSNSATNMEVDLNGSYLKRLGNYIWRPYYGVQGKQGTLFLTQPTAGTTSSVVSANATPTAAYVGSVVDPIDTGKTVTMDTTLTKILDVS